MVEKRRRSREYSGSKLFSQAQLKLAKKKRRPGRRAWSELQYFINLPAKTSLRSMSFALFCEYCPPEVPKIGATTEPGGKMAMFGFTCATSDSVAPVLMLVASPMLPSPSVPNIWREFERSIARRSGDVVRK